MRILMMGTGPFAVPTFQHLLDSEHQVPLLITRPAPSGGTKPPPPSPMRLEAERRGIAIFDPVDINAPASVELLKREKADLLVVADYGQILAAQTLATTRLGGINLHASLLPRYRGAAPINWALYHGETVTGVSVIHMTPRLDAGPIVVQCRWEIGPQVDAIELERELAQLGPCAVDQAITALASAALASAPDRTPLGTPQDPALATPARRLRKEDGQIDWTRTARQIHDQIRALKPWPGSYTFWHRGSQPAVRLLIDQAEVAPAAAAPDRAAEGADKAAEGAGHEPGRVVAAGRGRLVVATGQGYLRIERLQVAGKRRMEAADFLRGYPVRPGDRFGRREGL